MVKTKDFCSSFKNEDEQDVTHFKTDKTNLGTKRAITNWADMCLFMIRWGLEQLSLFCFTLQALQDAMPILLFVSR